MPAQTCAESVYSFSLTSDSGCSISLTFRVGIRPARSGHSKLLAATLKSARIATKYRRLRCCGRSVDESITREVTTYPTPERAERMHLRSAPPFVSASADTFSRMSALGRHLRATRTISKKSCPRWSSSPGCWPHTEKGWHGKPAVRMSCGPIDSSASPVMSPAGTSAWLREYMRRAIGSTSDAKTQSPPRGSRPQRKPPMPAKSSANVNHLDADAGAWRSCADASSRRPETHFARCSRTSAAIGSGTAPAPSSVAAPSALRCTAFRLFCRGCSCAAPPSGSPSASASIPTCTASVMEPGPLSQPALSTAVRTACTCFRSQVSAPTA
mmetsp:Transcript_8114/g.20826  ORF Transcript_8114/g.20826 Transcript_8114/m.20826 type:complete len:327 (+) Transcript_8114:251-1231(+)